MKTRLLKMNLALRCFLVIIATIPAIGNCNTSFLEHIATEFHGFGPIEVLDIDGDNDLDILRASVLRLKLFLYENDGEGNYKPILLDTGVLSNSIDSADIDGDGDLDIVTTTSNTNSVTWYENLGSGTFDAHTVSNGVYGPESAIFADMDQNGTVDILVSASSDNKLILFKNNGSEVFSSQIIPTIDGVIGISVRDFDADGDLDIAAIGDAAYSRNDGVTWFENNNGEFIETVLAVVTSPQTMATEDLDGDGRYDIILAADQKILWYRNDGSGSFTEIEITSDLTRRAYKISINDIEMDGDIDIIASGGGKLLLFKNSGTDIFESSTLSEIANDVMNIDTGDINSDGRVDVVTTSYEPNKMVWHENLDNQPFAEHILSGHADYPTSVDAADINGDGLIDLISSSNFDHKIAWYENDGNNMSVQHIVSITEGIPYRVKSFDVDNDGDIDLVSAEKRKVTWYENRKDDQSNVYFEEHLITTDVYTYDMQIVDFNQNGKPDILVGKGNTITYIENLGSGNFSVHEVAQAPEYPNAIAGSDIDGDGDMDIAVGTNTKITWYEQTSDNIFSEHVIESGISYAASLISSDLDHDGDSDLVAGILGSGKLVWYENDGSGSFSERVIDSSTAGPFSISSADIDNDGFIDITLSQRDRHSIYWYKNNRDGTFTRNVVASNVKSAIYNVLLDVDNDGDPDVLSASHTDDKIAWFENLTPPSLTFTEGDWHLLSLPCAPAADANTVADIFADDIPGVYNSDWVLYRYDRATGYVLPFASDTMEQGVGYWFIHTNATHTSITVDMPQGCATTAITQPTGCASIAGCFDIPLNPLPGVLSWSMTGYSFGDSLDWDRLRILDDNQCSGGCTLSDAETHDVFANEGWTYSGGPSYLTLSGIGLNPWNGFWIAAMPSAVNPRLLIPVN